MKEVGAYEEDTRIMAMSTIKDFGRCKEMPVRKCLLRVELSDKWMNNIEREQQSDSH